MGRGRVNPVARQRRSALDLAGESFNLLRNGPFTALAAYYIGTLPFILAFVYCWADLSLNPYAEMRAGVAALALALLFVWMKGWHVVFARRVRAAVEDAPPERFGPKAFLRTAMRQTVVHASGFLALPVALALLAPLPLVYGFYQNVTALDDGGRERWRSLVSRAMNEAIRWPRQATVIVWLLSPFILLCGLLMFAFARPWALLAAPEWSHIYIDLYSVIFGALVVIGSPLPSIMFLNISVAVSALPELLRMLLGVETYLSQSGAATGNSTFYLLMFGLAFLVLDPLTKTAFVLRCYYGESLSSGADLRAALRRIARPAATGLLIVLVLLGSPAMAQDAVSKPELDAALNKEFSRTVYAWRMPPRSDYEPGILGEFLKAVGEILGNAIKAVFEFFESIWDWFWDLFRSDEEQTGGNVSAVGQTLRITLYVLIALLVALIAFLAFRAWRRSRETAEELPAEVVVSAPDVEDESVAADAFPEDEWWRLAMELAQKGDYRLAMRAFFLSTLSFLAANNLIAVARFKSNREYYRELSRRAHALPGVPERFRESMRAFESVWYGYHTVSEEGLQEFRQRQEQLRAHVQ